MRNETELKNIVEIARSNLDPRRFSDETFNLLSIPSYDNGMTAEVCKGSEIGSNKTLVQANDVLFSKLNPRIPRVWLVDEKSQNRQICSTEFLPLRLIDEKAAEPEYLRFMFLAPQFLMPIQAAVNSSTNSHQRVKGNVILEQKIPTPPLEEQQRIVGRIKECLSRVDEIKQLRNESRKEASHILQSGIEDLLENISGEDKTIGDVVSIDSVLIDPREEEYLDLLHVGGANIVSGTGELINLKTAREENLISGKFVFTPGNVVYSKIRPYLRKVIRPDFRGVCSADIYPLNPNTELITADYLFYLLLSRDFTNYANIVSNRAGMPKVNRTQLFAYEFKLPDLETQNEITAKLDEMRDTSLNLAEEFRNSTEEINKITDSILRKAFAGEL